jgi:hypothetical protein
MRSDFLHCDSEPPLFIEGTYRAATSLDYQSFLTKRFHSLPTLQRIRPLNRTASKDAQWSLGVEAG